MRGRDQRAINRRPCRIASRTTAARVVTAWHHSSPLARHSLLAAGVTSLALALPLATPLPVAAATAVAGVVLATAAFVDAHERRLPNRLLALAFAVAFGGAVGTMDVATARVTLLGTLIAGGLLLLTHMTRGVGMGDVKMAAVIGASTSAATGTLLAGPFAIAMAAAAAAAYGVITARRQLPLGPALWFGWAAALVLTTPLTAGMQL